MENKKYKKNNGRQEKPSLHQKQFSENKSISTDNEGLVIGRNAVRELLKTGRDVDKIFVQKGDREGSIVALVAEAVSRKIPIGQSTFFKESVINFVSLSVMRVVIKG